MNELEFREFATDLVLTTTGRCRFDFLSDPIVHALVLNAVNTMIKLRFLTSEEIKKREMQAEIDLHKIVREDEKVDRYPFVDDILKFKTFPSHLTCETCEFWWSLKNGSSTCTSSMVCSHKSQWSPKCKVCVYAVRIEKEKGGISCRNVSQCNNADKFIRQDCENCKHFEMRGSVNFLKSRKCLSGRLCGGGGGWEPDGNLMLSFK